jgi:hypothetical protein
VGWLFPPLFGLLTFAGLGEFPVSLVGKRSSAISGLDFTKQSQWRYLEKRFHGSEDLDLWRVLGEKDAPEMRICSATAFIIPYYSRPAGSTARAISKEELLDPAVARAAEGWNGVLEQLHRRGYTHFGNRGPRPLVSILPPDWLERHTRLFWREGGAGTQGDCDTVAAGQKWQRTE